MKYTRYLLKTVSLMCVLALTVSVFSSCNQNKYTEKASLALGEEITIKIMTSDEEKATEILTQTENILQDCEHSLSATDKNSELSVLNTEKKVYASEFLEKVISDSVLLSDILGKSVDITMGELTALWGFSGNSPAVPDGKDIEKALSAKGTDKINFSEDSSRILIPADVTIDLGAVDKGAVCDRIYEEIKLADTPFVISFGGTVLAYGTGKSDGKWKLGLQNPSAPDRDFATLTLSPDTDLNTVCLSTVSVYDKSFTENGKTYHGILSPATGYPVETELVSVTVKASTAFASDILSTACFIAGLSETAMKFLSYFSAEAVFVFSDNTCFVTDGLKDSIKITDRSFSITDYDY